ncbi:penicillin acylase family protein [Salinirubellus salinus]|uniref:Penicillin acylase family protein n=1 Tax=Salinirubellus salinus TaxID=1364945 RepID=A0A9E7R5M1_9EURY|nr:penicillin acylase family protein [Salinirubellus salinus]UWM55901.1 penicillin acylase family protein [Salinirubellus salinus]
MRDDFIHAAVTVACAALLVLSAVFAGGFLSLAAPVSGEAWGPAYGANDGSVADTVARTATGAKRVENPYGTATVRYDEDGVPHITASNERAMAFAVGYVHARDRLFQMDLQRRLMAGNLSAAFGAQAVESDRFHRKMGFEDAAEASWETIQGTESGESVAAYTEGVNRYMDAQPLPLEFRLNDYEPTRWDEVDTLLVGKLIAWQLTGDFRDVQQQTVEQRLPEAADLYPQQLDHDSAIVDRAVGGEVVAGETASMPTDAERASLEAPGDGGRAVGDMRALYESLAPYQTEPGIGSNSWVVSGEHTDSGTPIVANDPHLGLTVPPVWYEQHLVVEDGGERSLDVRGVAFPGLPVVVIGQNRDVAWGFTNVGADQTDLYSYVRPSEDTYLYEGEEREIERTTETIPVKDGEDVEVTIERTVHGPLLEREGEEVAVSWLGLAGTREAQGIRGLNHAEDIDDVEAAVRLMDTPTQNIVAADRDGGTYFRITGRYPIRTVDGETVPGNRVFNGSAGHGEWQGWEPYGQVDWDGPGFHDYEEVPHVRDPEYLATANQRTMDDPPFYISYSPGYADPYRGARIYDRLDARVESDDPVTREFMQQVQRDVRSAAAQEFKPIILNATDAMEPETRAAAALELEDFRGRMRQGSEDALLYALFRDHYRNATFYDEYHPAGLDESYYPKYSTLAGLPADSEWFDDERTPETETRADIVARAMRLAVEEREERGLETYADYNVVDLNHPFPVEALDYPEAPTDGSLFTVSNFRVNRGTQAGSSWRMVATFGSPSVGIIPGGQSANYFSPHYADQLDEWREGEYREFTFEVEGTREIVFVEGGESLAERRVTSDERGGSDGGAGE